MKYYVRKFSLIFVAIILLFTLTGCNNKPDTTPNNDLDLNSLSEDDNIDESYTADEIIDNGIIDDEMLDGEIIDDEVINEQLPEEDLKKKVMANIDGNWKNTLESAKLKDYVFLQDGYVVGDLESKWRANFYSIEYISTYYDEEMNLCFETTERRHDITFEKDKEPARKYIMKADEDGSYNHMVQYTYTGTEYQLTATFVREEYSSYEELINNKCEGYALLSASVDRNNKKHAVKDTINFEKVVGYALLDLDGYEGDELILQEDCYGMEYLYYIFTIVNDKVKYRGSLPSYQSNAKTEGILYYDEETHSMCTYIDNGTAAPSFYNNSKLLSGKVHIMHGLGDDLRGSEIQFHDISEFK